MRLRHISALAIFAFSTVVQAQNNQHMVLRTAHTSGIQVDGVLDEADWSQVEPATDFVQFNPTEGEPASQRTEVRVLYGGSAIYVGAMMYDDNPDGIRTYLSRRDEINGADFFLVVFDSYNDLQTGYEFVVTAAGVQWDALATPNNEDSSWDAVWNSAVRLTPEGWVAEMEIPYSQLRFTEGETSWGINFVREIQRNGEKDFWAPITREEANRGFVQFSGRLEGLEGISPRRAFQITPYSLAQANTFEHFENRGETDSDFTGDAGVDFRVGLSSNITVDATINPDFGQVEADPAELNLSTYETFFSERRPFFLEGTQIFDYTYGGGDGALLYTRRIGSVAPIVGATKISGRLAGGTSFGVLGAATGDDFDPDRWYGAARVKQELGNQNYIGGGITAFENSSDFGGVARAFAGGMDWRWRVGQNESWQFEGTLTGTAQTRRGDPDLGVQQETAQGYALYLGFDKVRGFLTPGSGFRVYSDQFQMNDIGRFRQNNLIQARLGAGILWNEGNPIGPFRRIQTWGGGDQNWSYSDGLNRGLDFFFSTNGELLSFHSVELEGGFSGIGGYDVRETRGLGPIRNITSGRFGVDYRTDGRRRLVLSPEVIYGFDENGGSTIELEGDIEWNVSDRISLSANGEFGFENDWTAWAANEGFVRMDDGLYVGQQANTPDSFGMDDLYRLDLESSAVTSLLEGVGEYGSIPLEGATGYYVPIFGLRDTRAFSLSTRANVIFSPKLSLQLYGQIFTARGRYDNFQLLANPDELRSLDAYPKRRDFSLQSLHANLVLRWEYRPGSTLFVVWTQARNSGDMEELLLNGSPIPSSPYDVSTGDQISDTFSIFPQNAFLIKLNYLLMR
ncbi:MAG: DUF5916 domain-containing protein [Rubricoccaceae bacterium]|nr:DUF5916 domain-containing protein [Rubricoccaceae bacterium]